MKIERNIPITKAKRASKYPFEDMEKGDSFFVRCGKKQIGSKRSNIYARMLAFWQDHQKTEFTIRSVDGGLRCWRLK